MLPNTTTEIFIDYDHCDRLQDGAQNCLWSVHMPLFPLGTVGLNSSARDRALATASVAAWCPASPSPAPAPANSRLPHTRVTARRNRGKYLNWRTLDSARQFAAAARIGYNATATLAAMESVLSPPDDGYIMCASFATLASVASAAEAGGLLCADPSGYISDGDCVGLENAGFVAARSKRPFHAEGPLLN